MSVLRVHAVEPCSLANGPGKRAVVWVQGCSIRCPGCWNPDTHDTDGGTSWGVDDLASHLLAEGARDRVWDLTVSGGEPLDQAESVLDLIKYWKRWSYSRYVLYRDGRESLRPPTVILFSGYRFDHSKWRSPAARDIWGSCDVVVAGPYTRTPPGRTPGYELSSCETQITYNLTNVILPRDLWKIPGAECIIAPDGKVVFTGTDPGLAK